MDDLVQFLRARLDEDRERARLIAGALAGNASSLEIRPEQAAAHAQEMVTAAEAMIRLFEETIYSHLRVDGRAGRRADLQMRLMASSYTAHPDYRNDWAPDPV
ncbi:DUF6221 family protein [Streptomyces sp. NPDC002467]|uniref:DUF6221 family protein n=1 Tax=Streptomyces sp. NPDC002467 TaxID=3364647 RepID=UPI0036AD2099